ncbi:hypothetical protein Cgig2_011486 [Carnegiea gigantea]|uniref:Uncharacterized protein n=1 Tax=Carnegiea gigantea TaxID=171969 RepID=A0A9Q1KS64_9CARY|nr:hypothetical protein Cgig2_011486 [Carnegiea gigantea]
MKFRRPSGDQKSRWRPVSGNRPHRLRQKLPAEAMDASSKKETRGSEPNLKNTLHCPRKVAGDKTAGGSLAVGNRVSRRPPQRLHPSNSAEEMRRSEEKRLHEVEYLNLFLVDMTDGVSSIYYVLKNMSSLSQCKFCGREGNITMTPGSGRPLTDEHCEEGKYAPLMAFDCRGLEPVEFAFMGPQWRVESVEGTVYENVDLSEGEWFEYDEKGSCPVSISKLKSVFEFLENVLDATVQALCASSTVGSCEGQVCNSVPCWASGGASSRRNTTTK